MKKQTRLVMTMTPDNGNDTTLTYNCGTATMIITLNEDLLEKDAYSFYLYNDENMLLDTAETGGKNVHRRGRTLKITLDGPMVWIPGQYYLLMRNCSNKVLRFDITLDEHCTFTCKEPQDCAYLSLEDLLSSRLVVQKHMWQWLSSRPGLRQFRQKAIERVQLAEMNHFRNQLISVGDIEMSHNYIIYTRDYSMISQTVFLFRSVTKMGCEMRWVDCSTLYDPTLNNPYEKLEEVFSGETKKTIIPDIELPSDTPRVYCLRNISALMDNGGKQVIKKLKQHSSSFILTGTKNEVDELLEQNPSMREFFPEGNVISVEPFTLKEIIFWLMNRIAQSHIYLSPEAVDMTCGMLAEAYEKDIITRWTLEDIDHFVKRSIMPRYLERLMAKIRSGAIDFRDLATQIDDIDFNALFEKRESYDGTLDELNAMIGLDSIKRSLTTVANNMRLFAERRSLGLHSSENTSHHAIFMGNPGTGKTTVAKLLGKIYRSLGLLSKGEVICVDRTKMIGRFIGETEENMKQILQEARGNVLFVDEAYTLYSNSSGNDFGRRAVECLLPVLSQDNPDMLIIFAGYREEMDRLMSMNPGLVGRFPYKFLFEDYSTDELTSIAVSLLKKDDYVLSDEAEVLLRRAISEAKGENSKNFGNARWVEQFVHNGIIPALANRLATTPHAFTREVYQRIEATDVKSAYELFNAKTIELKPRRQVGFSA